jgi:tRNA-binding protein|tara:strand:- start:10611 stop:10946 length:336 start_codon:yes stop_codon:yes gene_type:complete
MTQITYNDFKKLEMRVGQIKEVERVPDSDKLYKMQVDVGKEKPIQIVTSLVDFYSLEELKDKKIVVLVNLEPAKLRGETSEGMLLCAETGDESKVILLAPEKDIENGAEVT